MSLSIQVDNIFETESNISDKTQLKTNLKFKIKNKISLVKDKLNECDFKIENYQNLYKYFKFKNKQVLEKMNNIYLDLTSKNKELGSKIKDLVKFRDNCDFLLDKIKLELHKKKPKTQINKNQILSNIDININNFDKIKENFSIYQDLLEKKKRIISEISNKDNELINYIKKININESNLKILYNSENEICKAYNEKNIKSKPNNNYEINQLKNEIQYLTKNLQSVKKIENNKNIETTEIDNSITIVEEELNRETNILNQLLVISKNLSNNIEKIKNDRKINNIKQKISQLASKKIKLLKEKAEISKKNQQLIDLSEISQTQLIEEKNKLILEKKNKLKMLEDQQPSDNGALFKIKLNDIKNDILNIKKNIDIYRNEKNKLEKSIESLNINLVNITEEINKLEKLLPNDISQTELYKKELILLENKEKMLSQFSGNNLEYDNLLILESDIKKYRFFLETQIITNEIELDCYNNSINRIEIEEQRKTIKFDYEQKVDIILNDIIKIKEMKKGLNNDLITLNTYLNSIH